MKLFITTCILVVFLKTGNLLSDNNLFSVNNVLIEKKDDISIEKLTDQAIIEAYNQLLKRVLLKEDEKKVSNLGINNIRKLVTYYNISKNRKEEKNQIIFNITFDKNEIHKLFFAKEIAYSDINDKEFYVLPISLNKNEIFIFSNNFFYKNWNLNNRKDELIEFILPLENIEIIQNINKSREDLLGLNLDTLFNEYNGKNVAIAFIDTIKFNEARVYLKIRVQDKIISKNLSMKENNLDIEFFNFKIINKIKEEIIDIVKSQNLIDIRTPSFLNVKFNFDKKNNLVLLNSKIKKIDLIQNIFIQELNSDQVYIKIKYLGKLQKIINELKNENIILELLDNDWIIKII